MCDKNRVRTGRGATASLALACLCGCAATPRTPRSAVADEPVAPDASTRALETRNDVVAADGVVVGQDTVAAPTESKVATTESDSGIDIRGSLSSRYRARFGPDAKDQDIYETLIVDVGDASDDAVTAHVMGRVSADIDGQSDRDGQFVYPSLADTYDDPINGLLYEAYVDVQRPPIVSTLRLGRQIDYLTPVFAHFDGGRVTSPSFTPLKITGGLYGGVPVRLYESSTSGDEIVGVWGEMRPWTGSRVRLDWMHVEDEQRFASRSDDLFGLSMWQRLNEALRVDAGYTRLEETDRDVRARANWTDARNDFTLQLSWYRLLETQNQFALEFDPFTSSLQSYQPFDQYRAMASKGIGENWRIDGGFDLRRLEDSDDEGMFNHDYDRGWIAVALLDAWPPGTTVTVTSDWWSSDGNDIESWGLDLNRKLDDELTVSAGTSYALYRYDIFLDAERDDVRFWYLKLKKQFSKAWTLECAYDYEDDSDDDFHVLTLGATWRF